MYFVFGVNGSVAGLGISLDYIMDNRAYYVRTAGARAEDMDGVDTYTGINLGLNYALKGFTPFLQYHSFDVKQGDIDDAGREDSEGNTAVASGGGFDEDNAQTIALGALCTAPRILLSGGKPPSLRAFFAFWRSFAP